MHLWQNLKKYILKIHKFQIDGEIFNSQVEVDEETLSPEEQKERKIMKLLLKIKNGTPPMRKVSDIYKE